MSIFLSNNKLFYTNLNDRNMFQTYTYIYIFHFQFIMLTNLHTEFLKEVGKENDGKTVKAALIIFIVL